MIFWKLKWKHKKWFIINQLFIFIALLICLIISWNVNKITLPTNVEKLGSSVGFITTTLVFILAIMNRLGTLFKVKSLGFAFMYIMFLGVKFIIDPVTYTIGLMLIPLLIDDILFRPIWNNIWYNEYDGIVKVQDIGKLQ